MKIHELLRRARWLGRLSQAEGDEQAAQDEVDARLALWRADWDAIPERVREMLREQQEENRS